MINDKWLFISAAKVIEIPSSGWATVEVIERFKPLFGRLIIKCKKGNTFSRYVFNMNKYITWIQSMVEIKN